MSRILVCDDDRDIVNAIRIYLENDNYEVVCAYNGKEAIRKQQETPCDLILLDIMMPEMDGIATISELRKFSNVPVIFLTAKGEDTDKVLGLTVGADDYITKPFNPVELLARVKSALRRYLLLGGAQKTEENVNRTEGGDTKDTSQLLSFRGLSMNDRKKEVKLDGDPLSLTPTEYDILKLFLENQGEVFSPKEIVRRVWHETPCGQEASVAVHIRHLREKIEINPSDRDTSLWSGDGATGWVSN